MFLSAQVVLAQQPVRVLLNDKELFFDVPPVIEEGRALVAFRTIFEALGMEVSWDSATRKVTGKRGGTTIELVIGSKTAHKNGWPLALDENTRQHFLRHEIMRTNFHPLKRIFVVRILIILPNRES